MRTTFLRCMLWPMARRTTTPKPTPEPPPKPSKRRKPPTEGAEAAIGKYFTALRGATPRWQIAERMEINGAPHPRVVHLLKRVAEEGATKDLKGSLARIIEHIEDGKHSISLTEFISASRAHGVEPSRILEATGFSRPALSVDDAIDGHPGLSSMHKQLARDYLRQLEADSV